MSTPENPNPNQPEYEVVYICSPMIIPPSNELADEAATLYPDYAPRTPSPLPVYEQAASELDRSIDEDLQSMRRVKRVLAGGLLASVVMTGAWAGNSQQPSKSKAPVYQSAIQEPGFRDSDHKLPPLNRNACAPISQEALNTVTYLAQQPKDESIYEYTTPTYNLLNPQAQSISLDTITQNTYSKYKGDMTTFKTANKIAKKNGVTLIDPSKYIKVLDDDLYGNAYEQPHTDPVTHKTIFPKNVHKVKLSVNTYINTARSYLKQFGISVTRGQVPAGEGPTPTFNSGNGTPLGMRASIINIINAYSLLPQQYVSRLAGTHKIVLTDKPGRYAGLAFMGGKHDTNYYAINSNVDVGVVTHETEHLATVAECGGITADKNDPEFLKFNNGVKYKNIKAGSKYGSRLIDSAQTLTSYTSSPIRSNLQNSIFKAREARDFVTACKDSALLAKLNKAIGKTVTFATSYGRDSNILEDKADTTRILVPGYSSYDRLDEATPSVRGKFLLELARKYFYLPKVGRYFAESDSTKYNSLNNFADNCDKPVDQSGHGGPAVG